ncbi:MULTISPECIES: hypothetical protein [Pseudofrankia]|uniref:hypothetical protein n=1 Tax=Pseudofrankia TaxID=2994363 RepID=UPI000234C56B|nr:MULTISPECIES: hypothetical protein [Pseudofrankia]OHV31033.1 hypothetical protein BCD49_32730 [Pseudofrankia sp. EUN1h]
MRLTAELEDTAVARWYRAARFRPDTARRETGGTLQRLNWHTRTRYYETLVQFLDASDGSINGLARDALAAAAGQRRPSTLYYLVSPKSPGSLAGTLRTASSSRLYERRHGERVLDLLVTETKVWSYWPHREGWLEALDDLAVVDRWLAAASLVRVVADWAVGSPPLAGAAGFTPPLAAVEDLLTLADPGPGRARADGAGGDARLAEVTGLLTTVARTALGASGVGPAFVLGAVHRRLATLVTRPPAQSEKITTDIVDLLTQLEHLLPGLSTEERRRMADELSPRLRAVLDQLTRPGPAASPDPASPDGTPPGPLDEDGRDDPGERTGGEER